MKADRLCNATKTTNKEETNQADLYTHRYKFSFIFCTHTLKFHSENTLKPKMTRTHATRKMLHHSGAMENSPKTSKSITRDQSIYCIFRIIHTVPVHPERRYKPTVKRLKTNAKLFPPKRPKRTKTKTTNFLHLTNLMLPL